MLTSPARSLSSASLLRAAARWWTPRRGACYFDGMSILLKLARRLKARSLPRTGPFWEYHGRMTAVSSFLKAEGLAEAAVLDVGGAPGDNLLRQYGIANVTTLDLNPAADIVASADAIPRPDRAFQAVTCIDTLEHIPKPTRVRVLDELIRVANRAVIVVAPHDTPANRTAEEFVLRYRDDAFLLEHRAQGLVDAQEIRSHLDTLQREGRISNYDAREIDDLFLWAVLMSEDYVNCSDVFAELHWLEGARAARRSAFFIRCAPRGSSA